MSGANEVAAMKPKPKIINRGNYVDEVVRKMMRAKWKLEEERHDGASFAVTRKCIDYFVIFSIYKYSDGKTWEHISVSRRDERMPDWDDMVWVKEAMCGNDAKAIIVIPPRSEHVNIHETCHHIWRCLDGDDLPDFTLGTGSI
jgi:hypothetical protein